MNIGQLIAGRGDAAIISCGVDTPLTQAVAMLAEKRIGAMPVMADNEVAGIFSERDLIYLMAEEGASCLDHTVGQVMTAPPITVDSGTTVDDALALMTRRRIRHLPVMRGDAMCGFISIGDLVKSRIDEVQHEANSLRAYIQTA